MSLVKLSDDGKNEEKPKETSWEGDAGPGLEASSSWPFHGE